MWKNIETNEFTGLVNVVSGCSGVKGHGFDVERAENGLFVNECWVVYGRLVCCQNHTHVTPVHTDHTQVRPVQWRSLPTNK